MEEASQGCAPGSSAKYSHLHGGGRGGAEAAEGRLNWIRFSVPASNRWMFALCLYMARIESRLRMRMIVQLSCVSQAAGGSDAEAQTEASETNRVSRNTMTQTARMISKDLGTSASSTPADVAMPLPPLNLSQQV